MAMTKEEFKKRWEKDDSGDGITLDEIADCAVAWGLYPDPKVRPPFEVVIDVCKAAGAEVDDD